MARANTLRFLLGLASLGSFGCDSEPGETGLGDAIVVHQSEFRKGKLPGAATAVKGLPVITSAALETGIFRPGAHRIPIAGRASSEAYAVGLSLLEQSTGYWVHPVGSEDLLTPGEYTWELTFDVDYDVEPGKYELGVVAFDKNGKAGQQNRVSVCVRSDLPDEGNVCDPTREPPAAIASLRWNADADLDLIIIAPDGTRYDRSNFSKLEGEEVVARLDADGHAGCLADGRHVENFVWSKQPAAGTWYVYTNLFDACQKTAVRFEVTTYRKKALGGGKFALVEEKAVGGELLRAQTNPGSPRPLYLTQIKFP